MATATKLALTYPSREWLDLRGLTEYAAVSERTLRTWLHRPIDPLPAVQVAGKILIRRSQFDFWLERHRIHPISSLNVDSIVAELVGNSK